MARVPCYFEKWVLAIPWRQQSIHKYYWILMPNQVRCPESGQWRVYKILCVTNITWSSLLVVIIFYKSYWTTAPSRNAKLGSREALVPTSTSLQPINIELCFMWVSAQRHLIKYILSEKSLSSVQLFVTPWNSPWKSPGQNTRVGSHSLLQGIFPTQRSNPGLPHCRWILYQLSYKGSP